MRTKAVRRPRDLCRSKISGVKHFCWAVFQAELTPNGTPCFEALESQFWYMLYKLVGRELGH
jgi:hypothetical protein